MNVLGNMIINERRLHGRLVDSERGAAGSFTGVSSDIQNDLICCIDSIIEDQIVQEIKNCTFISTVSSIVVSY